MIGGERVRMSLIFRWNDFYAGINVLSIPAYKLPSLDCSVQLWEPSKMAA